MKKLGFALLITSCLFGCTIPRASFSLMDDGNTDTDVKYQVVTVSQQTINNIKQSPVVTFPDVFLKGGAEDWEKLVPGDRLNISIWESGITQSTLGPSVNGRTDFEGLSIADDYTIAIPYAGVIFVKGQTASQLGNEIKRRLSRVVLNPQVSIRLLERTGALVTIQGGGGKIGRQAIERSLNKLSHLLAVSSPDPSNPEMMEVRVERNGLSASVRLADIYRDPHQDIALHYGDVVTFSPVSDFVNVLGAAGAQGHYQLQKRNSSMLDALALAKGLDDELADPRAVFLFRKNEIEEATAAQRKPYIYQVDMSQANSVFLARQLAIQDGDVIYVSNASLTNLRKVKDAIDTFLIRSSYILAR